MSSLPKEKIDDIIFEILKKSKSLDVFPTPVDKIIQYCELSLSNNNDFHDIPHNYVAKNVDAFKRMMKKVLGAFDREKKEIYINPSLPEVKKNFIKLHETGHDVLPWQKDVRYFDNEFTLSADVQEMFEAEANYFASTALFQQNRFQDEIKKLPLEIGSPMALAKKFGASNHAAIRRYVETNHKRCALLVLEKEKENKDPLQMCCSLRNYFQSSSFTKNFGNIKWTETLSIEDWVFVQDFFSSRRLHKDGELTLNTSDGMCDFHYHYFNTTFNAFVLLFPVGEKIKSNTSIIISPSLKNI